MLLTKYLKPVALAFLTSFLIISCGKDDSTVIETKEEVIEAGVEITIGSRSVNTDAFALYCSEDEKEGISLSNKEELLGETIDPFLFEEGDFMFSYWADGSSSFSLGGAFFDKTLTGSQFDQIIFSSDLNATIESSDSDFVIGSMEGTLLGLDENQLPTILLPISVTFNADVVGISTKCE